MKRIKNIFALVMTMIMTISMAISMGCTTVKAAETIPTYKITIENSTKGHTYEAYQIFTGDLSEGILSNVEWGTGVNGTAVSIAYSNKTAAQIAADLSGKGAEAQEAKAFADVAGVNLTSTVAGTATVANGTTCTISGLTAGYYLVKDKDDSQAGTNEAYTRFILQVVKDTTVEPKSGVPTVEKKVKENVKYTESDGYNDVADYNIGDNVPFMITGTLPTNYDSYESYVYTFTDTSSAGLDINDDIKVTVGNSEVTGDFTKTIAADKHSMTISCANLKAIAGLTADSKIVVTYTAKLNSEAAVIGLNGNTNKVYLTYSNNPNADGSGDTGKTPEDTVIVFTYELDSTKVDGETKATLKDAEFQLYRESKDGLEYAVVSTGKVSGWTKEKSSATTLISDGNGLFNVAGLDDGTYYLHESKAPAGYNLLAADVKLVISATTENGDTWKNGVTVASDVLKALKITVDDGEAADGDTDSGIVKATIANNKGATLPSTGGIGTTIFYIIGAGLMVAAGVVLVIRKKAKKA